jgi:hypothetical protein
MDDKLREYKERLLNLLNSSVYIDVSCSFELIESGSACNTVISHNHQDSKLKLNQLKDECMGFLLECMRTQSHNDTCNDISKLISLFSGQSSIDRTWYLKSPQLSVDTSLVIREMDHSDAGLGYKTWGSAAVMTKLILHSKINVCRFRSTCDSVHNVIELGCGTGLVGLSCASILSSTVPNNIHVNVILTDFQDKVLDNAKFNISSNFKKECSIGIQTMRLDWFSFRSCDIDIRNVATVLGSDVVYSKEQAMALPKVLKWLLEGSEHDSVECHLVLPIREMDSFQEHLQDFTSLMKQEVPNYKCEQIQFKCPVGINSDSFNAMIIEYDEYLWLRYFYY